MYGGFCLTTFPSFYGVNICIYVSAYHWLKQVPCWFHGKQQLFTFFDESTEHGLTIVIVVTWSNSKVCERDIKASRMWWFSSAMSKCDLVWWGCSAGPIQNCFLPANNSSSFHLDLSFHCLPLKNKLFLNVWGCKVGRKNLLLNGNLWACSEHIVNSTHPRRRVDEYPTLKLPKLPTQEVTQEACMWNTINNFVSRNNR